MLSKIYVSQKFWDLLKKHNEQIKDRLNNNNVKMEALIIPFPLGIPVILNKYIPNPPGWWGEDSYGNMIIPSVKESEE